jgi:hypothetical protein
VPIAEPGDEQQVQDQVQHRHGDAQPQWSPRIAGGTQRRRQHEEQHHAEAEHEVDAQERQRLRPHFGGGVDQREQIRRREVADRRQHREHADGGDERLVDDAVDLVVIAGAGETCD